MTCNVTYIPYSHISLTITIGNRKEHYTYIHIWVFPKKVVPQNGWFTMENPIKNGRFGATPIFGNTHIYLT